MNNANYMKELYHSAGKALLTNNFIYLKNLTYKPMIKHIYHRYIYGKTNSNIILSDPAGCVCHEIISGIYENRGNDDIIFIFRDDRIENCIKGLFVSGYNLFIYNDRYNIFNSKTTVSAGCCYPKESGRKYSTADYLKMADSHFEKSRSIDIESKI